MLLLDMWNYSFELNLFSLPASNVTEEKELNKGKGASYNSWLCIKRQVKKKTYFHQKQTDNSLVSGMFKEFQAFGIIKAWLWIDKSRQL